VSILSAITTGTARAGIRIVLAAQEKMGKTTLSSGAPGCLLVPCEVGYGGVNVPRTQMLQTWEEVQQFMAETIYYAQRKEFPYQTIIFDSTTAIERFIHDAIVRRDPAFKPGGKKVITMESAHGGYGKAYNLANEEFDSFLQQCDLLAVNAGINIVMTCHVFASKVVDPTSGEYDSWDLLLHSPKNSKTYGKRERITQWADIVGFLYEPVFVTAAEGGKGMTRAVSQNKGRVLGLSRTPGYTAGNRFGMTGEIPIPPHAVHGWNTLAQTLWNSAGIDIFTR
jgi:1,2-phenylacetyl-CoA epoxidase PaaB subunit